MEKMKRLFFIGLIINMILIITSISCMAIMVSVMSKMSDNQIEQPLENGAPTQPTPTPEPEAPTPPAPKYYEMSDDGKYIYFGEYPQSLKKSNVTITGPSVVKDYYVGSDGERYMKNGENYYKVEKLKWRILKQADGKAFVVSEFALDFVEDMGMNGGCEWEWDDNCEGYVYKDILDDNERVLLTDYEYSKQRKFLTNEFYNRAFNENEKSTIDLTEVDNSAAQTSQPNTPINTDNTFDYVFALSYSELINPEYGFSNVGSTDIARTWKVTDFAEIRGANPLTLDNLGQWLDENDPNSYAFLGSCIEIVLRSCANDGYGLELLAPDGSVYHQKDGPNLENTYGRPIIPAMYINL